MRVIKVPTGFDKDNEDLILEAEVGDFLPRRILYKHNDKHIYMVMKDKNGR